MPENFTVHRLRIELVNDPVSLGYSAYFSALNWTAVYGLINSVSAGFVTSNVSTTPSTLLAAVTPSDFQALSEKSLAQLNVIFAVSAVDLSTDNGFYVATAPFVPFSQSVLNMSALRQRAGTRAEMLFGADFEVTADQISTAITAL